MKLIIMNSKKDTRIVESMSLCYLEKGRIGSLFYEVIGCEINRNTNKKVIKKQLTKLSKVLREVSK